MPHSKPKQIIEINLPASLNFSSLLRSISGEVFKQARFPGAWCNRLKLVTDELFMNAVRYGSTPETSVIRIRFILEGDRVEFLISDDGTGTRKTTPEALQELISKNGKTQSIANTSGRGLAIIGQLWTDGLTVTKSELGGMTVGFVKTAEATPPPPLPEVDVSDILHADVPAIEFVFEQDINPDSIESIAAQVDEKIQTLSSGDTFILDFSRVTYINSLFIGRLAGWHNEVKKHHGVIAIKNANPQIKDVLNLVGLNKVICII